MGLTLLPLVVSLVHLLVAVGGEYRPTGDLATSELYVRDIGRYLLLVGPYSRDGWFHPGPSYFYLLAVPYRLLGGSSLGLPVTAVLVNAASVAGMAVVVRRRGGTGLLLCTLVACSLLLGAFGPDFLRSAWNPYVTVLPYALLLFLTWAMLCGDRWALPVAALVASFVAQTHIAYAALALPLLALGAAGLAAPAALAVLTQRRPGTRRVPGVDGRHPGDAGEAGEAADRGESDGAGEGRAGAGERRDGVARDDAEPAGDRVGQALRELVAPLAVTAGVAVVLWALPVYQQLTASPGNLARIMRYFRQGGHTPSLVESWRIMTAQYRLVPDWLPASSGAPGVDDVTWLSEPTYMYDPVVPVLLVPIVLAAVALWRHSARRGRALVGVWAVAWVVGFVATVRTIGPAFAYRLGWVWVLGMLGGLMALWAGWELLVRRRGAGVERLLVPVALVVLAGLGTANTVSALTAGVPDGHESAIAAELGPEVRRWLPEGDGVVLVSGTSFGALGHAASVRLDLERHGVDVRVPGGADPHGRPRTYTGQPVRAQLLVGVDGDAARDLTRPELELVAYSGELSPRELRALGERRAELEARFRAGELPVDEYSRQAARLNPQQVAVAVFALPVSAP